MMMQRALIAAPSSRFIITVHHPALSNPLNPPALKFLLLVLLHTQLPNTNFLDFISQCSLRASRDLHDKMTERILYATMAWFDATPSGRLINRFSQDISTIDTGVMSRLQVRGDERREGGKR
jgi:ABC-type multidrug transport system fused ATPase/permease subunit